MVEISLIPPLTLKIGTPLTILFYVVLWCCCLCWMQERLRCFI